METPEYIEGLPTEKKKSHERRNLIEQYYELLWKALQRGNGTNGIFNPFLGVTVIIKKGESDKKTINRASADWKSTYAVKHLKQVITLACGKKRRTCLCGSQDRDAKEKRLQEYGHLIS